MNSNFSRETSRMMLDEYRNTFEYNLNEEDAQYWSVVVKNYSKISPLQLKILNTYFNKEEKTRLDKTVSYLGKIIKGKNYWIPQSIKEDIIYFRELNAYEYSYSWQAPKLEEAKNNRGRYLSAK